MTSKPDKKKGSHRERIWSVRVNEAEDEQLQTLSSSAGFNSISTYIRSAALKELFSRTDAKTIRQLILLGNNLNQLTRRAHSEGLVNIEQLISRTVNEINQAVIRIGKADDHTPNS